MMSRIKPVLLAVVGWGALGGSSIARAEEYNYPVSDPFFASVVGTPTEYMPELPSEIRSKNYAVRVFEDREIPALFWEDAKFRFSLAYQKGPAPLIFVIAGTGASYQSPKMDMLEKVFFQQGYHVICITSPTHPDFITSASTTCLPGDIEQDVRDLYHVMELALDKVSRKIDVTDFYLTGYSLGGTQAAFLSKLDDERQRFNFKKVLMINPSVSLFRSVGIIDQMLEENIPGGMDHFHDFFQKQMKKFSELYGRVGNVQFDHDFLYRIYKASDEPVDDDSLKAIIGTSFRVSSANMVFTSDAMSRSGVIVPPNYKLSKYEHTTGFFKVSAQMNFNDYFQELLYPNYQQQHADITLEEMIQRMSLVSLRDYLKNTEKIGAVTNADDFILTSSDLDFLRDTLGARVTVYPVGGHCGNMGYRDNVAHMVEFLK